MDIRLLALIKIKNFDKYLDFHEQFMVLIQNFNGTFVSKEIADAIYYDEIGDHRFDGIVEIQFPSEIDVYKWQTSEALRSLNALRQDALDLTLMRIAG